MTSNRTMFLTNFLNRNITDEFRPYFEIIYGLETFFLVLFPLVCFPIINAAWRTTSYHRNIRLRIVISCLHTLTYTTARFTVLCHQYFDFGGHDLIVVCSMIREGFISYALVSVSMKAFDRFIAMRAWSWYESGKFGTFLLFCFEEVAVFLVACMNSFLIVFGYIPLVPKAFVLISLALIGPTLFSSVLYANRRAIERSKRGGHSYSVARTFQLQENVAILSLLAKTATPLVVFITPAFLFFAIYAYLPYNSGYDSIRFFSVALYDLWLAITSVVIVLCLPYYEPKFVNNLNCALIRCSIRSNAVENVPRRDDAQQVTNAYFDSLAQYWENPV